jgi:hypothetical protein
MRRTILAGLAVAGLVACGKGRPQSAADSARSIELAKADSSYRLNDRPPPSPASRPTPSPSRSLTLESGTQIDATTQRTISSRKDKAGETFTASVSSDVKDGRGRVVIPAGSTLNLTITELHPANDKSKADGRITVLVSSVTVGGQTYPVSAGITSMAHTLKGRGVGATEVEKTAAGAVIGGIAGRIIGGNSKGTIIGAVVGGGAGAAVAVETANRDVVVAAGTPMVVKLNGPLTVAVK